MKTSINFQRFFFAIGIAIPAVIVIFVISKFGVNVPYFDDWTIVHFLKNMEDGKLSIRGLLSRHGGHIVFFPRLLMMGLSSLTRWNILYELYAGWTFIALTALLLWNLLKLTLKDAETLIKPLTVAHSFLLFSLCQAENFIWGWQSHWFLTNFLVVLSIWILTNWPGRWTALLASAIAAFIATFSIGSGLFLWGISFYLILDRRNWQFRHIYFWVAISACSIALCFFSPLQNEQNPFLFSSSPFLIAEFFFMALGAPFGGIAYNFASPYQLFLCLTAGVIGLGMFLVSIYWLHANRPDLLSKYKPWIALIVYGILALIMVAITRVKFGIRTALSTRYTTFSLLFWCGVIVLISVFVFENRRSAYWKRNIALILGILFLLGYSATAVQRYARIQEYSKRFEIGKRALYDYPEAEETDLRLLSPTSTADSIRVKAAYLESRRLSLFADGTGEEHIQRFLNEWNQKARDLNLGPLPVPAGSIHVKAQQVYTLSDDALQISCSKNAVGLDVNWNEVPDCNQVKSQRILMIYSQRANVIVTDYQHFNRKKTSMFYSMPLADGSKVFHIMALPGDQKFRFRLEYSAKPPFEDQMKITCLAPQRK